MYGFCINLEEVREVAREKGCIVVEPEPDELFIDLDSEAAVAQFQAQYAIFDESGLSADTPKYTRSPSGEPGHYHVTVYLVRPVSDIIERLLLQALLGSDLKREMLAWRRVDDGCEENSISVFFEREITTTSDNCEYVP